MTILSHEYWVRRYGGDRAVIGQSIVTPGNATGQIVGVLAPGAELLFPPRNNIEKTPDFWIASRQDFAQASRTAGQVRVIGRLKPGVTIAQAQQQMDKLAADLRETYPVKKNAGVHINVVPMHESLVSDVRLSILALMGAVVFVLLIACANVANLMMTQAARRERELAVKTALGAGRATLVRQILAESLLLALAGSLVGLGLARVGIAALQRIGPQDLPRLAGVSIDVIRRRSRTAFRSSTSSSSVRSWNGGGMAALLGGGGARYDAVRWIEYGSLERANGTVNTREVAREARKLTGNPGTRESGGRDLADETP